jgi:uncharacterized membrane protein
VYLALKFLHIFLAIVAVGFTSSFGLIMARAAKGGADGRELKFALGTIHVMGRIGHVCFLLLLITGFALIHTAGYPWYSWLKWSAGLVIVSWLVAQFLLLPTVPRRLAILETKGPTDPEFIALSKRSAAIGAVLGLMALVVLWLMVSKPS